MAPAEGEEGGSEGDAVRLSGAEAVASEGEGCGEGEGAPGEGDAGAVGVLASAPGVGAPRARPLPAPLGDAAGPGLAAALRFQVRGLASFR